MKAIDNFDINYEVKFSTYAVPVITGEIKRFIRDDGIIKISRSIKENAYKVKIAIEEINNRNNLDVSIDDIKEKTGLTKEDIVISMDALNEVESLNKIVYASDDSSITLGEKIAIQTNEYEKVIDKLLLQHVLEKLDDFQRRLINLRYFENKTQTQTAEILHISQVQVSRFEKKILLLLRSMI